LANFAKSDHTAGYIELLEDEKETSVSFFLSPREKEMEVSFLVIVHQTQCDQIGQFATIWAIFSVTKASLFKPKFGNFQCHWRFTL